MDLRVVVHGTEFLRAGKRVLTGHLGSCNDGADPARAGGCPRCRVGFCRPYGALRGGGGSVSQGCGGLAPASALGYHLSPLPGLTKEAGLPSVTPGGAPTNGGVYHPSPLAERPLKGIGPRPAGSWRRADQWGKQPKSTLLPDAERVKTNSRRALALWPVSGWESGADNHHALSVERISVGLIKSYGHGELWLGGSAVLRMTRDSLAAEPRRGARFASHVKSCRLRSRITAAAVGWPPRLWVMRYSSCREPPKRSIQQSGTVLHIRAATRAEAQRRFGFNPG
jgi:hypothetical protein